MAEYIKRSEAMSICQQYSSHCFTTNDASGQDIADRIENDIVEIPTADVKEVKHGHWIKRGNEKKCSVCGFIYYSNNDDWNGCPNCLAKMDGVQSK